MLQEAKTICLGWWAKTWELPMVRTWPWKIRKNCERVKEGNMIGKTTGPPTILTSNKFLLGSRSDGLKFKWPQGENWPPSPIVSYYYQNADQKLREYLFTVQVKPKLVSRVTYSLRKAAESGMAFYRRNKQSQEALWAEINFANWSSKFLSIKSTPLHQLKLYPSRHCLSAGLNSVQSHSPGPTFLRLTQPCFSSEPKGSQHKRTCHPILLAGPLSLLFPPLQYLASWSPLVQMDPSFQCHLLHEVLPMPCHPACSTSCHSHTPSASPLPGTSSWHSVHSMAVNMLSSFAVFTVTWAETASPGFGFWIFKTDPKTLFVGIPTNNKRENRHLLRSSYYIPEKWCEIYKHCLFRSSKSYEGRRHHPHFIDEKADDRKGWMICPCPQPASHRAEVLSLAISPPGPLSITRLYCPSFLQSPAYLTGLLWDNTGKVLSTLTGTGSFCSQKGHIL